MKTTTIMLLSFLAASTSFALETTIPKGAIKNGTLKSDQYLMHKMVYGNGARVDMSKPVILEVTGISQVTSSKVKSSDIGKFEEGSGSVTNKKTAIAVKVIDGSMVSECILKSKSISDGGSDFMGYDSQNLGCEIESENSYTRIILSDYSLNTADAGVEITVSSRHSGFFRDSKDSYTAFISAE